MSVTDNYEKIADHVAEIASKCGRNLSDITILPVSKTQSLEKIIELADLKINLFGESKLQEAKPKIEKVKELYPDTVFHFIGRFQTNKADKIIENFDLIHSIDRIEAIDAVSKAASKRFRPHPVLIQVNIAREEQKNGVFIENLEDVLEYATKDEYISLKGLMMMPPYEENAETNRKYFQTAKQLFDKYIKLYPCIDTLSMGMSDDYSIAIEEGATLLRIGSNIFGRR